MSPKVVDITERKSHIIKAAIPIIAQRGMALSRMEDIADAAGIGKGTIYEYFKSKAELFNACFHFTMDEFFKVVLERYPRNTSPSETIRILFRIIGEQFLTFPKDYYLILSDIWLIASKKEFMGTENPYDLAGYIREFRTIGKALIEQGITEGEFRDVDAYYHAVLAGAVFDGLILHWMLDRDSFDMVRAAEEFAEMFLKSIRKEHTPS